MKYYLIISLIIIKFLLLPFFAFSQNVGIADDGNAFTPNSTSLLELKSTLKGLLVPRMTYAQRNAITSPAQGLMVYQTDNGTLGQGFYYNQSATSTANWIYVNNSQNTSRNNTVTVKSVSDFPAAVGSVITLASNVTYILNGNINIGTNTITMGTSNVIMGIDKSDDILTYTGSGSMITSDNKDFSIKTMTLTATTSESKIFNVTGSTCKIQIMDNIFGNCRDLGVFNGGDVLIIDRNIIMGCYDGFEVKGTLKRFLCFSNIFQDNVAGTGVYIPTGTFNAIQIQSNYFETISGITAINIATGITVSDAIISSNFFRGAGTFFSGISTTTSPYVFIGNSGISDDDAFAFCRFRNNVFTTAITTQNVYYKATGTNHHSYGERFDYSSVDNKLIYIGSKTINAKFIVTGNVQASSNNETIMIAVFKNGSTIAEEVGIRVAIQNEPYAWSLNGSISMSTNDYLEIHVMNTTSTNNIGIIDFQFRVNK